MSKFIEFIKKPKVFITIIIVVLVITIIIAYNWNKIAAWFTTKPINTRTTCRCGTVNCRCGAGDTYGTIIL